MRYLVSAIVSAYKSEAFLRECLEDLTNQTLFEKGLLEIVVVDSGSPENEWKIVEEFQKRSDSILYLRTSERETVYAAWNRGIRASCGKYLTNANTDDRHAPEMLEVLADLLEKNPDQAAVYSHFYITDVPHQTWQTKTPSELADWHPPFSREALLKGNFMGPQPMWRRSLHDEYGYFDPSFKVSGDWEFFLRVSQTYSFLLNRVPLGLYYRNPGSLERSAGTRHQEDRFIRELYTKNRNQIIRRPFIPESGSAFAARPSVVVPVSVPSVGPMVSVCMAAYNTASFIRQAIESVLAQTYRDFELVVVDDGSTDGTAAVVQSFQDRRIRFFSQPHQNFASAINRAIQEAHGRFVLGVDSDDFIAPDYLERMITFVIQNPDYDYYYPEKLTLVDEAGKPTGVEWKYDSIENPEILPALLFARGDSPIPNSGSLKRRALFEKTGLYRELDNVEDFEFLCRCGPQIRFRRVAGGCGYFYRRLEKSNTVRYERRHRITAQCLEEMIERYQPEQLYPFLKGDDFERKKQFWNYIVSIFEKHADTYRQRQGEVFARCAEKYRQRRPEILVREGFKRVQNSLEKKNVRQAAELCRQLLSDKSLYLADGSRQTLQQILEQIETNCPEKDFAVK
ncbi:MAG TPA: glycosyltransferase family 2 protein [Anaerohalosphaeraceae bacterium]|nr:glycosyltransferase family 2 protein [Anaerohalosphaeraceae bacterium]HPP55834.1 glycosyltransferase family 2 protein [Anaerohalosphaeraceae bacterium]